MRIRKFRNAICFGVGRMRESFKFKKRCQRALRIASQKIFLTNGQAVKHVAL
jgi:hypothetical protein